MSGDEAAARERWNPHGHDEIVHRCPPIGSDIMPCCKCRPYEMPLWHRLTLDPALVTCRNTVDLHPEPTEVAAFSLPAATVVRVHHPSGPVEYGNAYAGDPELAGLPFSGTIPGDREVLGWGAKIVTYFDVRVMAHGKRKAERPVWQAAVKAIAKGGVVYVQHEQQDWYGKTVWVATGLRREESDG